MSVGESQNESVDVRLDRLEQNSAQIARDMGAGADPVEIDERLDRQDQEHEQLEQDMGGHAAPEQNEQPGLPPTAEETEQAVEAQAVQLQADARAAVTTIIREMIETLKRVDLSINVAAYVNTIILRVESPGVLDIEVVENQSCFATPEDQAALQAEVDRLYAELRRATGRSPRPIVLRPGQ